LVTCEQNWEWANPNITPIGAVLEFVKHTRDLLEITRDYRRLLD